MQHPHLLINKVFALSLAAVLIFPSPILAAIADDVVSESSGANVRELYQDTLKDQAKDLLLHPPEPNFSDTGTPLGEYQTDKFNEWQKEFDEKNPPMFKTPKPWTQDLIKLSVEVAAAKSGTRLDTLINSLASKAAGLPPDLLKAYLHQYYPALYDRLAVVDEIVNHGKTTIALVNSILADQLLALEAGGAFYWPALSSTLYALESVALAHHQANALLPRFGGLTFRSNPGIGSHTFRLGPTYDQLVDVSQHGWAHSLNWQKPGATPNTQAQLPQPASAVQESSHVPQAPHIQKAISTPQTTSVHEATPSIQQEAGIHPLFKAPQAPNWGGGGTLDAPQDSWIPGEAVIQPPPTPAAQNVPGVPQPNDSQQASDNQQAAGSQQTTDNQQASNNQQTDDDPETAQKISELDKLLERARQLSDQAMQQYKQDLDANGITNNLEGSIQENVALGQTMNNAEQQAIAKDVQTMAAGVVAGATAAVSVAASARVFRPVYHSLRAPRYIPRQQPGFRFGPTRGFRTTIGRVLPTQANDNVIVYPTGTRFFGLGP